MPSHKELIDVIRGITSSFNSRNNDFQGYWALGILYQFAKTNHIYSLTFDLLNQVIQPDAVCFQPIVSEYHSKLYRLLNAKDINFQCLQSTTITIEFGQYFKCHDHIKYPLGDPYVIIGKITDNRGKIFESTIYGKCRLHDPTKEQQSNRINKK